MPKKLSALNIFMIIIIIQTNKYSHNNLVRIKNEYILLKQIYIKRI